jgi:hypothetical protein
MTRDDADDPVGDGDEEPVGDGDGDDQSGPGETDPAVRDAVREELADVVRSNPEQYGEAEAADAGDGEYPSLDDPVSPQSIDVEHAAFVVVGVAATVGLVVLMLGGL